VQKRTGVPLAGRSAATTRAPQLVVRLSAVVSRHTCLNWIDIKGLLEVAYIMLISKSPFPSFDLHPTDEIFHSFAFKKYSLKKQKCSICKNRLFYR
jgi:hypothetical protein